jgi:hypothetical protein
MPESQEGSKVLWLLVVARRAVRRWLVQLVWSFSSREGNPVNKEIGMVWGMSWCDAGQLQLCVTGGRSREFKHFELALELVPSPNRITSHCQRLIGPAGSAHAKCIAVAYSSRL